MVLRLTQWDENNGDENNGGWRRAFLPSPGEGRGGGLGKRCRSKKPPP